jgi:Icc protein
LKLQFAHISDTHITPTGKILTERGKPRIDPLIEAINTLPYSSLQAAQALVERINALPFPLDFVLHTGDIMHEPGMDEDYETARGILASIKYPVYYVAGNHDRIGGLRRVLAGHAEWGSPFDYQFECQGVQVVCLDTSAYGQEGEGRLSVQQLDWLAAICTEPTTQPLIVALHHNPLPFGARLADGMGLLDDGALHRTLLKAGRRLRGVFYGHIHQSVDTYRDGILYSAAVSGFFQLDLWPGIKEAGGLDIPALPGFNVVTLTDTTTYVRRCSYQLD